MRKGLGYGKGRGYYNLTLRDPVVHSLSARGVKSSFTLNALSSNQKKRIKSFYNIQIKDKCLYFDNKPIPLLKKKIYLKFNEKVSNESEAEKNPRVIKTSGDELLETFAPKLIMKDKRMESFIATQKNKIGLLSFKEEWEGLPLPKNLEKVKDWEIFFNAQNEELWKSKDGKKYYFSFTIRTAIDSYNGYVFEFSRKPTKDNIIKAHILSKIKNEYIKRKYAGKKMEIKRCWECGHENVHFLDLTSSIGEKELPIDERFDNFREGYCGC